MVTLLTNSEKFDGPKILASLNDTDYEQVEMNSLKKWIPVLFMFTTFLLWRIGFSCDLVDFAFEYMECFVFLLWLKEFQIKSCKH